MSQAIFKPCPNCRRHSDEVGNGISHSAEGGSWYSCNFCGEVTPLREIMYSGTEKACAGIAQAVNEALPETMGYMLMVFDFGEKGEIAYMSNAAREDMIEMLRHQADYLESLKR